MAAIEAQLEPHVRNGDLSGAVVAGRGDRVLYARGFHLADAERRTPFTPETPSHVAAIAETITAAAVWLLAEEGRLELGSPVQRYLPLFPWPEPTLEELLAHTAGLPDRETLEAGLAPGEEWSGARAVELLARGDFAPLDRPGEVFDEADVGYDVLAHVVETVEGKPLLAFAQERLLGRLGIEALAAPDPLRALSYRREAGWLKPDPVAKAGGFTGGSGLYLSALDLYRWCVSFYDDPGLREETLRRASPVKRAGEAPSRDALGWTAAGGGRRYRFASHRGHTAFAYRDESRRHGVVFVSNTAMPTGLRPRLARALVRILEGGAAEPIALPEPEPLGGNVPAGDYDLPALGRLELAARGDRLEARLAGGLRYRVRPAGAGRLFVPGLDAWLAFSEPEGGVFGRVHWTSVFSVAEGPRLAASAAQEEP